MVEIASAPVANYKKKEEKTPFKSPSITKMLSSEELLKISKEHDKIQQKDKETPFDQDKLMETWELYRSILKRDPEKSELYNALSANIPKLIEDNVIKVEVFSGSEIQVIEDEKESILTFLNNKLQNTHIELKVTLENDNDEKSKMVYTDHDKYNAMKQKNEALDYLRLKFNLDIEF